MSAPPPPETVSFPSSPSQGVGAAAAVEHVVPRAAGEQVAAAAGPEGVVPGPAVEGVVPAAAEQLVVAGLAEHQVVAGPAAEEVVPVAAEQLVVAGDGAEVVVAGSAEEHVGPAAAGERVVAGAAVEQGRHGHAAPHGHGVVPALGEQDDPGDPAGRGRVRHPGAAVDPHLQRAVRGGVHFDGVVARGAAEDQRGAAGRVGLELGRQHARAGPRGRSFPRHRRA